MSVQEFEIEFNLKTNKLEVELKNQTNEIKTEIEEPEEIEIEFEEQSKELEIELKEETNEFEIEFSNIPKTQEEKDPTIPQHVKQISKKDIEKWNNKSDFSGEYKDLVNAPNIPSKTSELINDSQFIKNTVDNLVNYYLKSETYSKEEINQLASTLQNVSIGIVDVLPAEGQTNVIYFVKKTGSENDIYDEWIYINNKWEHIGNTQIDLTGYATEKWVKEQNYMPINDFQEYMNYFYYKKEQIYNKEEIDDKLSNIPEPTIPLEFNISANLVEEDGVVSAYTNTGYIVSDEDIRLQPIIPPETSGTNRFVYTNKEVEIIFNGSNKIRRSENGIDFITIQLPYNCKSLVYNPDGERLYGSDGSNYIMYSEDDGLTWKTTYNTQVKNTDYLNIGYGTGFKGIYKAAKKITNFSFNNSTGAISVNSSITSTIIPEFVAMINNTQFVWCNSSGTFKYGAGSQEGVFASLSGININMLKRVNNITFLGLKNSNIFYILEPAMSVRDYKWIPYTLPSSCTVNDIIFNPNDQTYYIFTDINTYYKTKDFIDFVSVDKEGLRGIEGHFTLMGIQMTTAENNMLLLAPTRTKIENKLQEHKRALNKDRWVGAGLQRVGEEQIAVKSGSSSIGVSSNGIFLVGIDENHIPLDLIEGIYVGKAPIKLMSPFELENWYFSEGYPEYASYACVKFKFTEAGSFLNMITWEDEIFVEENEFGYLFYDQNMTIFNYVKICNLNDLK